MGVGKIQFSHAQKVKVVVVVSDGKKKFSFVYDDGRKILEETKTAIGREDEREGKEGEREGRNTKKNKKKTEEKGGRGERNRKEKRAICFAIL